jgi:ankyrin repeat protein
MLLNRFSALLSDTWIRQLDLGSGALSLRLTGPFIELFEHSRRRRAPSTRLRSRSEFARPHGADPNAVVGEGIMEDTKPLVLAVRLDREDILDLLLDSGAQVDSRDWLGSTPLMEVALHGKLGMVMTLVAYGADVNARIDATRHAHFRASFVGDEQTMRNIEASGRLNTRHFDGMSVLDEARVGGSREVIKLLRSLGAK